MSHVRISRRHPLTAALALLGGSVAAAQPPTAPATFPAASRTTYHVARTVHLGGAGAWDYLAVDTAANRLYVSRGSHVMAVDLARDVVIGDLPHTPGVHGIALAPDLGRGYTSNGGDASVTAFDLRTLAPTGRYGPTGAGPDAIGYDPASRRVFTFNGRGESMTALDARTGRVVGTVALGGKPEFMAFDGRGMLYVNNETTRELLAVDTRTLAVTRRTKIAGCEEPRGLAIDARRGRLFVGCGNQVMTVHDAATGRQLATQTVRTKLGARTLAVDPAHHRVYVVTAEMGPMPAPGAAGERRLPAIVPGTFQMLVIER